MWVYDKLAWPDLGFTVHEYSRARGSVYMSPHVLRSLSYRLSPGCGRQDQGLPQAPLVVRDQWEARAVTPRHHSGMQGLSSDLVL